MSEGLTEKQIEQIYSIEDIEKFWPFFPFLSCTKNISINNKSNLNKKKKKVTIKEDVDIINIETWKKFNMDVSQSGGCPEWDKKKIIDYEDDIYQYEDENEICNIF